MAPARLTALVAVALAVGLAASLPSSPGAGLVSIFGWVGAGMLIVGLFAGYRSAVSAAAVAFVVRLAVMAPFDVDLRPPLWVQAMLLVLMIEFAGASFTLRTRPADLSHIVGRALFSALLASALVQVMADLVEGAEATGVLVRAAGVGALVVAAGWVIRIWRRSGLSG